MKRILILLLSLLAAVGGQAQGCIKGTVTDAKTGEPLPFVGVTVLRDGEQVHNGTTDWDGVFVVKPLDTAGAYDIAINNPGYIRYRREGVDVKPDGFTFVEILLNQNNTIVIDTLVISQYNYGSKDGAMLAPLPEYKIVSRELKRLLDRVIDGKCNTYDHNVNPRRIKRGEYCNLSVYLIPSFGYEENLHFHVLKSIDPTLPWPLDIPSPLFSFDSTTVYMSVTTTYYPDAFSEAEGYVKYRGRIFFLVNPVKDLKEYFERREWRGDLFKYREIPTWARRDLPTWIYTKQQGVWYRWMEFPNGF